MRLTRRHRLLSLNIVAVTHTFDVITEDQYVGKYFYCICKYDGEQVVGNWTLSEGSQYASINSNGKVTINSGVQSQRITIDCSYTVNNQSYTASKTITISYDNQLAIECSDTLTGTSGNAIARYNDNIVTPTWSIILGSQYATINASGEITILDSGAIIIQAEHRDYRTIKNVNVVYVAGQSTSTEVNDDGSVTTTTTTTVENQDGSTTETSTSTTTNEDGSISNTNTETTTQQDGSSTSTSTTTNQDGTSSQSETNVASDGSSTNTTTNYDANGDPTSGTNNTTDVQGNSNTQEVTYDANGDPTVTAYTIDTTGNENGTGETISGDGVNTEFIPFTGTNEGFELHIRFRSVKTEQPNPPLVVDTEDTSNNYHFTILASKDPVSPWPGFHIRWTLSKNNYSSGNMYFGYKGTTGSSANRALAASRNNNMYDFTIAYDPQLKKYPSKLRCIDNLNGGATLSYNIDFAALDYDLTIGYNLNQQGQPYRYSNLTVYEFSVTKL